MGNKNAPDDELFCDLVISILSVNNYSLEKTFQLRHAFSKEGITDPARLPGLKAEAIYTKLISSGYDRGEFMTYLFSARLFSLGELISRIGIDALTKGLAVRDVRAIGNLLKPVKGVGPVVLRNYAYLRDFRSNSKSESPG